MTHPLYQRESICSSTKCLLSFLCLLRLRDECPPKGPGIEGWSQPRTLQGNSRPFGTWELPEGSLVLWEHVLKGDNRTWPSPSFSHLCFLVTVRRSTTLFHTRPPSPQTPKPQSQQTMHQNLPNCMPKQPFPLLRWLSQAREPS